jgi:hypothetical protein
MRAFAVRVENALAGGVQNPANKLRFNIRQSQFIRPAVRAELDRVTAFVVAAIDQDAAKRRIRALRRR